MRLELGDTLAARPPRGPGPALAVARSRSAASRGSSPSSSGDDELAGPLERDAGCVAVGLEVALALAAEASP